MRQMAVRKLFATIRQSPINYLVDPDPNLQLDCNRLPQPPGALPAQASLKWERVPKQDCQLQKKDQDPSTVASRARVLSLSLHFPLLYTRCCARWHR